MLIVQLKGRNMKKNITWARFLTFLAVLVFFAFHTNAKSEYNVNKLADGFRFTEGPAVDANGNIFFTDVPASKIHKYTPGKEVTLFMDGTDRANGLYFDNTGNLIACVGGSGKLVSIDPNKNIDVLVSQYNGKRFNSLNDLWISPNGGIYFTDPRYGRRDNLPQDKEAVYYLPANSKQAVRVVDDMVRPNGLIGTEDGKILYIADHGANKTYKYKINEDGSLSDKTIFANQGSDGMTIDQAGNIYLTSDKVEIYDPCGVQINAIEIPEKPSNVCFGKNYQTLYVTARTGFYSVDMPVKKETILHSFTVDDIDGNPVSLEKYKGNVVMVVNVASKCGLTVQYAALQEIYEKYRDKGFVILGFPANNFGNQEPGSNEQIKQFCTEKYDVTFPMFSKISVKGNDKHPLYEYLTSEKQNENFGGEIKWNFTKFLIAPDGQTLARFEPRTKPTDDIVIEKLEQALKTE